jgi:hypothetical protein
MFPTTVPVAGLHQQSPVYQEISAAMNNPPRNALNELYKLNLKYSDTASRNEILPRIEYFDLVVLSSNYDKRDEKNCEKIIANLTKIKEKYPQCTFVPVIDREIDAFRVYRYTATLKKAKTFEEILQLQQQYLNVEPAEARTEGLIANAKALRFIQKENKLDPAKVSTAMLGYLEEARKVIAQQPQTEKTAQQKDRIVIQIDLETTFAYIVANNSTKAFDYLNNYYTAIDDTNRYQLGKYYMTAGECNELLGRKLDAIDAYISAAHNEFYEGALKVNELYRLLYTGKIDSYPDALKSLLAEPPFRPKKYIPEKAWSGKTVLAEIFDNTESQPCAATDLAFRQLLNSYDAKYVVVLEYHMPAQMADPFICLSSRDRSVFYRVEVLPTVFVDGILLGGSAATSRNAEAKYNQFTSRINPIINRTPEIKPQVSAELTGNKITVSWQSDKYIENALYHFALVQRLGIHIGSSGIAVHKMIVRNVKTLENLQQNTPVTFTIPEIEMNALQTIREIEKNARRKITETQEKLDRTQLMIVFFIQDKNTKSVYNATSCEVVVK